MSNRRVIETQAQLDAIEDGAVLLDECGDAMQKRQGQWWIGDVQDLVSLPAIVLLESWER